jgi:mRNA-degrading endonuclease RelE of RelBE toxin-antitoxin system
MLEIVFTKTSIRDWAQLDGAVRTQFKKKLHELRLEDSPRLRLRGFGGLLFKVKITSPQFRLVYRLDKPANQLIVIAAGNRDSIYDKLEKIV